MPALSVETDPLLTVKQLAELEGMSQRRVRWFLERGLPHYKAHGIRVRLSEWRAFLAERRRP